MGEVQFGEMPISELLAPGDDGVVNVLSNQRPCDMASCIMNPEKREDHLWRVIRMPHTVGQAVDPFILIKLQPQMTATRHHLQWKKYHGLAGGPHPVDPSGKLNLMPRLGPIVQSVDSLPATTR